jgi:polysaccharide biosynthesis protein VpsJ
MNSKVEPLEMGVVSDALLSQARKDSFCGYDPFDALNSVLFKRSVLDAWPAARVAWLQLHKRSRVNLRPLIGVEKRRNPKGVALFILGLIERYQLYRREIDLCEATSLADWLLGERADKGVWLHHAWGYHFDWAARAFYVPQGKPNAITTCYVSRALYAVGAASGLSRFTDAAVDAAYFLDSLYIHTADSDYYAYIPGEVTFVHNASLWTAALVAEATAHTGDNRMRERALRAARQSVSMQRPNGAWVYGTLPHHQFIDGFHTGYNLEALNLLGRALHTDEFDMSIQKGMEYYRNNFILPNGTVKYYHNKIWPLDTHSVAQAIVTFTKVGGTSSDLALAERIVKHAVETLYMPDRGRFVYQKTRFFTNRINYLRWTQAWAFYALSVYGVFASQKSGGVQ